MGVDEAVAEVDHGEMVERIEAEGEGFELGQLHRGGPDRLRTEPAARAEGDRGVIGHAAYHHVGAFEVATVATPQKALAPP